MVCSKLTASTNQVFVPCLEQGLDNRGRVCEGMTHQFSKVAKERGFFYDRIPLMARLESISNKRSLFIKPAA